MEKPIKKELGMYVLVMALIMIAYLCRLPILDFFDGRRLVRGMIYSALYVSWGISLYGRINHPRVRVYMVAIAGMMVFWFMARNTKFLVSDNLPVVSRYMWYLYYLPMLFIPLFAVFVAFSIGMPERERLSRKA